MMPLRRCRARRTVGTVVVRCALRRGHTGAQHVAPFGYAWLSTAPDPLPPTVTLAGGTGGGYYYGGGGGGGGGGSNVSWLPGPGDTGPRPVTTGPSPFTGGGGAVPRPLPAVLVANGDVWSRGADGYYRTADGREALGESLR